MTGSELSADTPWGFDAAKLRSHIYLYLVRRRPDPGDAVGGQAGAARQSQQDQIDALRVRHRSIRQLKGTLYGSLLHFRYPVRYLLRVDHLPVSFAGPLLGTRLVRSNL